MGDARRWTTVMVLGLAAAVLLSGVLLWISGALDNPGCPASLDGAGWDRCNDARGFILARGANIAAIIGIALSAIGTVALVITIGYSARATEAAVEGVTAARQAIEDARQATIREQRPYMAVVGFVSAYKVAEGGGVASRHVGIEWQNTGHSPARNVRSKTSHALIAGPLAADFAYPDRTVLDSVGTVGSGTKVTGPTGDIALADIGDAILGKYDIHVWSWVEYEGFESGVRYRSEHHCRMLYWGADDPADLGLGVSSVLEEGFNGLDETCSRAPTTPLAPRLSS